MSIDANASPNRDDTRETPDDAAHRIIREHAAMLARVAWGYVDNAHDHDDLMQEILLAMWRALPRFRGEASERTFVLRIAHNRGVTFAMSRRPAEPLTENEVADAKPSPEAMLIRAERHERLSHAIRKLVEPQRQAIMLQLEGLSLREIAQVQGISETNASVRLARARTALRAFLEGTDA